MFFELIEHIRRKEWNPLCKLILQLNTRIYPNDYGFSIAVDMQVKSSTI